MAVAFSAIVYDGRRCKIFDLIEADASAAANTFTSTFIANAMTNFQGAGVPLEGSLVMINSVANENVQCALLAMDNAGFSVRKQTAGAGVTAITWRVTLRIPRGIAA